MKPINRFLLDHGLSLAANPCISPDFCLDWERLRGRIAAGDGVTTHPRSRFGTAAGRWELLEDRDGDCAWLLEAAPGVAARGVLAEGAELGDGRWAYPATFENLLELKNLVLEADPGSTIFPGTGDRLGRSTLGIGARFTTLHWPAVEWAMSALSLGVTANQNSIPRELVYDVDEMLAGRLDTVPFPFIGASVPEGHQGQSVQGMSHGAVLSKLKTGFHHRRLAWSFNADHQPIGGKFDAREDRLVAGAILASYITFDLSPELAATRVPDDPAAVRAWVQAKVDAGIVAAVRERVAVAGITLDEQAFHRLLATVWPAIRKMKLRDAKYAASRAERFRVPAARAYLRELSIDELPGLTTPETTAVMLALCEALAMPVQFVAPAFGFQKNMPYPDNDALRALIARQWAVCRQFGVSIGFHSGSGKSAENYRVMGEVTGGALEIKTSGRYTYEMGVALAASQDPGDQALWRDWHAFTRRLAVAGAFSADETERRMARTFITEALRHSGRPVDVFGSPAECAAVLDALEPSPDHMFWFEYNFLYVLAAGGRAEKSALGDHSPAGYAQRARFYAISPEARLRYAQGVAGYIIFLAEHTGLAAPVVCAAARKLLAGYTRYDQLIGDISR